MDLDLVRTRRDRVTAVLTPHLGASRALERANNIAQALGFGASDPVAVAFEMLRHLELADRHEVAEEVGRAWTAGSHAARSRRLREVS